MSLSRTLRRASNFAVFHCPQPNYPAYAAGISDTGSSVVHGCRIRRPSGREGRSYGRQMRVPRRISLPSSRMFDSHPHGSFNPVFPYASSLYVPQESVLIVPKSRIFPNVDLLARGFCCGNNKDSGSDSDSDSDSDHDCDSNYGSEIECGESDERDSRADPSEVDRVCKVIDELFHLDRNMEAVLDESNIKLSHALVLEVLERYKHARKPAFRFFNWAAEQPGFAHDTRTYNRMMTIFGKTKQFETMMSMLEDMGEKGLLTMKTFIICMKSFGAARERKKAVGMLDLMKKYNYKVGVETINCLLDCLGRAKLGKEAQAMFEKLRGRFTPNLKTYTVLLNGWCRAKKLLEAGKIWNLMVDEDLKPDIAAHNIMLDCLLRCKKRSDAIKLFELMKAKGPSPDVKSYTIMLGDICKQTKMEVAVRYFEEMLRAGCRPDSGIYTCLIKGFGKQKRMDRVSDLLKEMKANGCPPDGHTFNVLIKVLTSRRMPDDAVRVYKKMVECGIEPSIHTYNMMMKSYFQSRNSEMGVSVWVEMKQKGCCPDENSYTVFIRGLISQGRCREAAMYLEEMIQKGMKVPYLDFNRLAADFSRAGRPEMLEELAEKMRCAGKIEASNVIAKLGDITRGRIKSRNPMNINGRHNKFKRRNPRNTNRGRNKVKRRNNRTIKGVCHRT